MRRYIAFFIVFIMLLGVFLCGCSSDQIDRNKELKQVMDTCDSKWSQAFPTGTATFEQAASLMGQCDRIINAGVPLGSLNLRMLSLISMAGGMKGYEEVNTEF